jgi:hypothetical protein
MFDIRRKFTTGTLAALIASAGLAGCDDMTGPTARRTLALSFVGAEPLANGFHYEGWAIVNGEPRSTGKFNVSATGALVTLAGAPIADGEFDTGIDLTDATAIVITIEPAGDADEIPTATHYFAGAVTSLNAALTVSAPEALNNTFSSALGSYVLATPTDGDGNNEKSGVWFLSLATGSPTAGLTLPTLPAGWAYEGWALIGGQPVTTGRFLAATGADMAAPYSGAMGAPGFPGEDFLLSAPAGLTFPTDLAGGMAVISIEPQPDDSPAPFALKPLVAAISAGALDHVTYNMTLNTAAFPTGTAVIR